MSKPGKFESYLGKRYAEELKKNNVQLAHVYKDAHEASQMVDNFMTALGDFNKTMATMSPKKFIPKPPLIPPKGSVRTMPGR